MITENNLSLIAMIIFFIGAIACLIWAAKLVREDNKEPISNPLNDKYFYEVWEQYKPHYVND